MARKKIIFVIVEGPSDETALGYALSKLCDKEQVYVHVVHYDITTKGFVTPANIVTKIGAEIKKYMENYAVKVSDFKGIVHIVDTDGSFIPDESVVEDPNIKNCYYTETEIHTSVPDRIRKRNKQKKENLFRLIGTGNILTIPYRIYYMSCNLDHVLYNKQNSTDNEKENDSYDFANKYKNDLEGFIKYICESDFSVNLPFKESWEYIDEQLHSLERHSNLCIFIEEELSSQINSRSCCQ